MFVSSKFLATFVTQTYTIMNTRLKQFLAAENITQAQFADTINVVRASVSHILSGRNNPSFDFIRAMMSHYPNLNMDWLMFGKGKMYKNSPNSDTERLFPEESPLMSEEISPEFETVLPEPVLNEIRTLDKSDKHAVRQRKAVKIIVMYDDGSYQEL